MTDQNNNYAGFIRAEGNGYIPGLNNSNNMLSFDAAFTGAFIVTGSQDITFTIYADDGWLFGVGANQSSRSSTYPVDTARQRVDTKWCATHDYLRLRQPGLPEPQELGGRGNVHYDYDAQGRLTRITQPGGGQSVAYAYDAMGKRTVMTLTNAGNNYPTSYAYNADNQLAVVTGTQGVARYSYDGAGRLQQLTLPNALTTNYSYDGLSRLTNLHQDSPFGPLTAYSYTLNLNGNKTQAQEWVGGQAGYTRWQYNAGQRLALEAQLDSSAVTQTTTSYLYAPTGNRLSVTTNGSTTSYGYNRLDQLTVITNPNSTYVYQNYDARGNLYQTVDGGNTTSYSYDYANRMVGASVPGHSVSYGYDAEGHRVQQTVDGSTTNYLWDEQGYGEVALEQSGGSTTSYLLAGGQRLSVTSGSLTNYYLPDGLGNIRTLAGSSGNLTSDRYNYDAYGSLRASSVSSTQNAYRYKGQQYDQATGLYNLRARYYNSTQGQFLSRDKAGYNFENPVELNRYGYVAGNPVTRYDPSGNLFVEGALHLSEVTIRNIEGLSYEGQLERNLLAGDTYTFMAFALKVLVQLNFPEFTSGGCTEMRMGIPLVIAYSAIGSPAIVPHGYRGVVPFHPIVAANGIHCREYKEKIRWYVEAALGGEFTDGDDWFFGEVPPSWEWSIHAEVLLYLKYFGAIPQEANMGLGTFWGIGVSRNLCDNDNSAGRQDFQCSIFFQKGATLMYQPRPGVPMVIAEPYIPLEE